MDASADKKKSSAFSIPGFQSMSGTNMIIAVITIILIIIIMYNLQTYKIYSSQIEGLWMAPDSFCAESDIDGMLVYVGPSLGGGIMGSEKRKACLIMHANNATIAYKKLELNMSSVGINLLIPFGINTSWSRKTRVEDDTEEVSDPDIDIMDESDDASTIPLEKIMPNRINITIDLKEGKMTWTGKPLPNASRSEQKEDKITYAELYKDNISSALGKNLSNESGISSFDSDAIVPEAIE
jgi:hypothetical protein